MDTSAPRTAAVLLMIFQREGESYVVLTRRTDSVAHHKGQISLPGGTWEPSDGTLLQTALRETEEELGIQPDTVEILGQLADVPTNVTNFTITPFVARLAAPPTYRPATEEVAEVIEVPFSSLNDPSLFSEAEKTGPEGTHRVYFFQHGDHIIWGATARILKQFLETWEACPGGARPRSR